MVRRIVVDRALCDGNGLCAAQAPRYFMLDGDDELHLLQDVCDEADLPDVQRAVQMCPKAALRIAT